MAFKFSNFHFYVQNCRFRALCCRFTANQAKIQKSTSNTIQPTHSHDRIIDLTKNTQKLSSPSVFIVFIYSLCQAPDHEYEDLSRAFFSKLSFCRKKTLNNEIWNRDLKVFSKAISSTKYQDHFSVYTSYESSKLV